MRRSHRAVLALAASCAAGLAVAPAAVGAVAFHHDHYAVGGTPTGITAGDFDGDGWQDLATTISDTGKVAVLRGMGLGGFSAPAPDDYYDALTPGPFAIASGDVDGDGDLDIVTANTASNHIAILTGLGNGSFVPASSREAGTSPRDVELADLDGDGNLDIVTANEGSNDVSVWLGTGGGGFAARVDYAVGWSVSRLAVAALNGDGLPDIVTMTTWCFFGCPSHGVSVLFGDTDDPGAFAAAAPVAATAGLFPTAFAVADLDSDDDADLATIIDTVPLALFAGDGFGSFTASGLLPHMAVNSSALGVADFDGDGDRDLVPVGNLPSLEPGLQPVLGDGAGGFAASGPIAIGGPSWTALPSAIAVAELNGRYAPDIAVPNSDAGVVSVLLNRSPPALASQPTLDLGGQPTGTRSASRSVTFANTGDQPAHVSSAKLAGVADDEFMISDDACAGATLERGETCTVRVRFFPVADGPAAATLRVTSDAATSPNAVELTGTGIPVEQGSPGPVGPPGPAGAAGPQGPPGQVVCRNNAVARLTCELLFAPGTWRVAGTSSSARVTLSRNGRVYARGRARLRSNGARVRIRLELARRPRPGTYRLTLRLYGGRHTSVLRRTVRIG